MRPGFATKASFTSQGRTLVKLPSVRQVAQRRRWAVVAGIVALAMASAAVGMLDRPHRDAVGQPHTGPFSYFPSE